MITLALLACLAQGDQDLELARRVFAEARAVGETDGGALWGVRLDGPVLLVDAREERVYANAQVATGPMLEDLDGVFAGPLPASIFPANAAQAFGGLRWTTIVLQAVPNQEVRRRELLAHELFHRVAPELGLAPQSPPCAHLETEEGRTWLRLELRALSSALLAGGDERLDTACDALLFRARRRAAIDTAAERENRNELNEGLAQYTGVRMSGLAGETLDAWVARGIAEIASGEGSDPIWMLRRIDGELDPASLERSFAYQTGAAYGLLLDEVRPEWREELTPGADLGGLLAEALAWEAPQGLERAALERGDAYGLWFVARDERARRDARERREAEWRALLVVGPVLRLPLAGKRQISFRTPDMSVLPGEGRVYTTVEVSSDWGRLVVEGGVALSHLEANGSPLDVVVPAPDADDPKRGTGWTLALEDGWEIVAGDREGDLVVQRD